jgi:hypothetical protein
MDGAVAWNVRWWQTTPTVNTIKYLPLPVHHGEKTNSKNIFFHVLRAEGSTVVVMTFLLGSISNCTIGAKKLMH